MVIAEVPWTMLSLLDELHQLIGTAAAVIAISAGLLLGSVPYRLAASTMALELIGWSIFTWVLAPNQLILFSHTEAVVIAGLFALIVLRYRSLGLVVMLALQLAAVFIHLSIWMEATIPLSVHAMVLNGVGWLMVATLFVGSLESFRRRRFERADRP